MDPIIQIRQDQVPRRSENISTTRIAVIMMVTIAMKIHVCNQTPGVEGELQLRLIAISMLGIGSDFYTVKFIKI